MKVLINTCVWSHALRHKNPDKKTIKILTDLINDGRAVLIGPIKQEILSGVPHTSQFEKLKGILSSFEEILLKSRHFEQAAEFSNLCRKKGIQGSTIDFLICAIAYTEKITIFTLDKDFENYVKYLPIKLFK